MPSGKELRSEQRRERHMLFGINGDGVTPTITTGSPQGTIVRNGVGDYTITFRNAYGRAPLLIGSGTEDNAMVIQGASTVADIQILIEDASSNAPADLDVNVLVMGWDSLDEI